MVAKGYPQNSASSLHPLYVWKPPQGPWEAQLGRLVRKLLLDQHIKKHKDPFPVTDPWTRPPIFISRSSILLSRKALPARRIQGPRDLEAQLDSLPPLHLPGHILLCVPLTQLGVMALLCKLDCPAPPQGHLARATTTTAQNLPPLSFMHIILVEPLPPAGPPAPLKVVCRKGLLIRAAPTHTSHPRGALPQLGVSWALMKTTERTPVCSRHNSLSRRQQGTQCRTSTCPRSDHCSLLVL